MWYQTKWLQEIELGVVEECADEDWACWSSSTVGEHRGFEQALMKSEEDIVDESDI